MKIFQRLLLFSTAILFLMTLLSPIAASASSRQQVVTPTNTPVPPTAISTNTPTPVPLPSHTATIAPTMLPTNTPTPALSPTGTATIPPTATPTAPAIITPTQDNGAGANRPIIVIKGYKTDPESPKVGQDFDLKITLCNEGTAQAHNVIFSFASGVFLPRKNGGVLAEDSIHQNKKVALKQVFTVSSAAENGPNLLNATVSYTDDAGNAYNESYTFTINVKGAWSGVAVATTTPTPIPGEKAQLVIVSYQTDMTHLRPGDQFTLNLQVVNKGKRDARSVSMSVGGVSSSGGQNSGDGKNTGEDASVSMSGGDFSHFAPIGASNVQTLGLIAAGADLQISQKLIVGISTSAGAYSLKISFVYTDKEGKTLIDDQVVTLMVYTPPSLDISFYQPLDILTIDKQGQIPLQVVNLGKKAVVLGHITLSSSSGSWEKNMAIIGSVDAGDFYSLDAIFTPQQAGTQKINVAIEYTDAFNQSQMIEKTLQVEVQDAPQVWDEGMNESPLDGQTSHPTTLWQRIVQFFKGFFGFDSGTDSAVEDIQQ